MSWSYHQRQNLVPISSIENTSSKSDYEIDDLFGKGDCIGKGFDSSGRYFSYMYASNGIISPPSTLHPVDVTLPVHYFNDSSNQFECQLLRLQLACPSTRNWYLPFYDASSTRWFLFQRNDKINNNKTLTIHTGTLRELFGQLSKNVLTTTFECTIDNTIELDYVAPDFRIISPKVMQEHCFQDGYLILVVLEHYFEHRYCVDIIKFDEKKASLFKRIRNISPSTGLMSIWNCKTFLNLELDMLLIMDYPNKSLLAFDFYGNEYFIHNIEFTLQGYDYFMKFGQLKGSLCYLVYGAVDDDDKESQVFQIFNINETGLQLKDEIFLDSFSEKTKIERFFDQFYIIEFQPHPIFGRCFIGFNLIDIQSNDVVISFKFDKLDNVTFNWDKREIVLESKEFDPYHIERSLLPRHYLPSFNRSLKHHARLACLRLNNDQYLKENLPFCLQQYLGIDSYSKMKKESRVLKRSHEQSNG
eukprot:TCONS_00028819-protein